jgi:hypothetical protein
MNRLVTDDIYTDLSTILNRLHAHLGSSAPCSGYSPRLPLLAWHHSRHLLQTHRLDLELSPGFLVSISHIFSVG